MATKKYQTFKSLTNVIRKTKIRVTDFNSKEPIGFFFHQPQISLTKHITQLLLLTVFFSYVKRALKMLQMFWICANEVSWLKYMVDISAGRMEGISQQNNKMYQMFVYRRQKKNFALQTFSMERFLSNYDETSKWPIYIIYNKVEMWYASRSKWFTPNNENHIYFIEPGQFVCWIWPLVVFRLWKMSSSN